MKKKKGGGKITGNIDLKNYNPSPGAGVKVENTQMLDGGGETGTHTNVLNTVKPFAQPSAGK
jgi:hypothetical protein